MISRKRWSNVEKERSLNIKRATYHAMLSRKSRAQISSNNRGYHVGMKSARCFIEESNGWKNVFVFERRLGYIYIRGKTSIDVEQIRLGLKLEVGARACVYLVYTAVVTCVYVCGALISCASRTRFSFVGKLGVVEFGESWKHFKCSHTRRPWPRSNPPQGSSGSIVTERVAATGLELP